jgi:hypothetical protein
MGQDGKVRMTLSQDILVIEITKHMSIGDLTFLYNSLYELLVFT